MVTVVLALAEAVMKMLMVTTGMIEIRSVRDVPAAAALAILAFGATCSAELGDASSGAPLTAASAGYGAVEPAVGFCLTGHAHLSDASLLPRS